MLSPYRFFQCFFNVPDADVIKFLKVSTFWDLEEIHRLKGDMKRPFRGGTIFVHGDEGLQEALRATEALRPGAETKLDWEAIEGIAEDLPSYCLPYEEVLNASVVDPCVVSGLLESKSAARRLLKQGGLYLNNCRVDTESKIGADDIVNGKVLLLSAGK